MRLRDPLAVVLCAPALALLLALPSAVLAQPPTEKPPTEKSPAGESTDAAITQYRAAVAFQNRQLYDLAVDEWKKLLKEHADDPLASKAGHYLGVCRFQLKDYAQAEKDFQAQVAAHPEFEQLDETYANLGLAQYNQGQAGDGAPLGRAAASFGTLLEKFPESKQAPLASYYLAESLYGLDKKKEAIAAYNGLLEKLPQSAYRSRALYGLGVTQEETGAAEAAGKTYDTFLKEFPQDPLATEVGMRRGDTLLALGQPGPAEARFQAAAAVAGFELADYATLRQAVCRYEQEQYAPAAQLYAQLVEKFPKSAYVPDATLAAGKCFYLAGDQPQARGWLGKWSGLGGEAGLEAAHWLARSLLKNPQEGKAGEALALVEQVLPAAEKAKSPLMPDLQVDRADALYDSEGRRGDAVDVYAAVAEKYPDHASAPQAGYLASFAALGAGKYDAALAHAEKFLARHAKHDLAADVIYVQAEANLQLRKYAEADALYARLAKEFPDRGEVETWQVRRGLALHLQKKPQAVIDTLGPTAAALKAPANQAEAQFLLGSSRLALGEHEPAIAAFEAALQAAPQGRRAAESLLLLSRARHAKGDAKGALETVGRVIQEFPQSDLLDRAHFRRGEYLYAAQDWPAAAGEYEAVLKESPDSPLVPHALFGLAWTHLSRGQHPPAIDLATRVIEQHAKHTLVPAAHYARAMARQQSKEYAAAIEDVVTFLKSKPQGTEKADALYVRGLAEAGLEKHAEAAATFAQVLEDQPKYAAADKVLYELAWSEQERGEAAAAVEAFARLGQEFPDSPLAGEALYRVGEHRYGAKKYAAAAEAYASSLAKSQGNELGEKAGHKLAWAHFQQKQYDKAHATFASQVASHPEGPLAADGLVMAGESLFQQKKYSEAAAAFQQARASGKKPSGEQFEVICLLHAGQSAAQLGQWQQSLQLLTECGTRFPESPYGNEVLYEQAWAKQNLGQADEALAIYKQVAEAAKDVVGARARFMAGELQFLKASQSEKPEEREALAREAIGSFFKVAYGYGYPKSPEVYHTWQADATFEAARCLETLRKVDAAKKLFQELIERYPQSDKVSAARKKLAALGG